MIFYNTDILDETINDYEKKVKDDALKTNMKYKENFVPVLLNGYIIDIPCQGKE